MTGRTRAALSSRLAVRSPRVASVQIKNVPPDVYHDTVRSDRERR